MNPLLVAELAAIGAVAGVLGSLVGLGGGFIVIPLLRLAFALPPAETAAISLVMVLANSLGGSIGYLQQRRADVKLALTVAATGIPASLLGAYLVGKVSVAWFDYLYGAMLVYFFIYLMRRRNRPEPTGPVRAPALRKHTLVDARGERFTYATSVPLALLCGVILGFISSFFGIGGGVIFVVFFLAILRMPAHVVTATSTLAIVLTSPAGVLFQLVEGRIVWSFAIPLAVGGVLGGQLGPHIARRLSAPQILLILAWSLLAAAAALVLKHLIRF